MSVCICVSFVVKTAGHILMKFLITLYTISYSTDVVTTHINKVMTLNSDSIHLQDTGTQILNCNIFICGSYLTILSVAHISYQVIC
jgi:hypothetical protein